MVNVRRAIVWSSAGQYLVIAINFISLLVMARLLAPAEYGVSVLGGAVLAVAEAVREIASGAFLVRERELTRDKVRSTTTLSVLVTAAVTAALALLAVPLARLFELPALAQYLHVAALGYMLGPLIHPQMALFGRDMAFNRMAAVNLMLAVVGTGASILLALMGFGALSFAWAGVTAAATAAFLCLILGTGISIYRPTLTHWRDVLRFGAYSSATAVLGRLGEALPVFIFGRFLSADAVAIGHRAALLSLLPERLVLAAVGPVTLPEFSRRAREGMSLQEAYLTALAHVSVVQWPAMLMLAALAEPIVRLVLGSQWLDVVPLLRIVSPALALSVPIAFQYATLVTVGAVHRLPQLLIAQLTVMTAALWVSAPYGLHAAAWSMYVAMPIVAGLSLVAVRSAIEFAWRDLWVALARSACVSLMAAAGPITVALLSASPMSLVTAAAAVLFGAAGWALGLYAVGHPFWNEVCRAVAAMRRSLK